jgi:diaminopimelate decarboxylase
VSTRTTKDASSTAPGVPGAPTFEYQDGVLCCEEVPLDRVHRAVGASYVYSTERLRANARRLLKAFSRSRTLVCFAMKANSNPAIVRLFRDLGLGAEVSSGAEFEIARHCGVKPNQMVSNGNARSESELRQIATSGAFLVSLDSDEEIQRLEEEAARLRGAGRLAAPVRAAIRVNPDIDAGVHPDIATGISDAKFGMPADRAADWFLHPERTPHLRWLGMHVHIGSQVLDTDPLLRMLQQAADFIDELDAAGVRLEVLNLGGGFGIDYDGKGGLAIERFADAASLVANNLGLTLVVEPGRFLVADACALVGKVLLVKRARRSFAVTELGMNDLLRPTLYDAHHEIVPVKEPLPSHSPQSRTEVMDVVGPICESGDVLAKDRRLPPPSGGSLIAVTGAGAYGYTMSSNYNGRPRLAEVLVNGSQARVIRRRETWEDLIRLAEEEEIELPAQEPRVSVRRRGARGAAVEEAAEASSGDGSLRSTLRASVAQGLQRRKSGGTRASKQSPAPRIQKGRSAKPRGKKKP